MRKNQYFPFWIFSAKQGHHWYHFYNVFGMTRSFTGDWTRGPPALEVSTLPLGYRGGSVINFWNCLRHIHINGTYKYTCVWLYVQTCVLKITFELQSDVFLLQSGWIIWSVLYHLLNGLEVVLVKVQCPHHHHLSHIELITSRNKWFFLAIP